MLDNDFCDINRLAAKHLEHQSTAREVRQSEWCGRTKPSVMEDVGSPIWDIDLEIYVDKHVFMV
jgi:hypothetical protein